MKININQRSAFPKTDADKTERKNERNIERNDREINRLKDEIAEKQKQRDSQ